MSKVETYASVWDAIADTPEEAANLRARAELMQKIAVLLKQHEWTQAERGMRVTVGMIVGLVATGHSNGEILGAYPYIEEEDIRQALTYAAWRVEEIELPLPVA
jgi:hypothetical protein